MSGRCSVCGTPYSNGDYRCEGEINGVRCGKDLVGSSSPTDGRWWA